MFRERRLRVSVERDSATYSLVSGEKLEVSHDGDALTLAVGAPQTRPPVPPPDGLVAPTQPAGRAPVHRAPRS